MQWKVRAYQEEDLPALIAIWNTVVAAGNAFPQEEPLNAEHGAAFFAAQSLTAVAVDETEHAVVGLYILHPNYAGRCGHICNASYAVRSDYRGRGVGEALVRHSLVQGMACGFRILQFNAVVRSNAAALHLYQKLGFTPLGVIPGGFRNADGVYEDIIPHIHAL